MDKQMQQKDIERRLIGWTRPLKLFEAISEWNLESVADYVGRKGGTNVSQAVEKYRKFMLMTATAQHSCVPSRQVDEIWHAHILHTRDYIEFCSLIGQGYIHHDPSLPGEQAQLEPLFQRTSDLYEEIFGFPPDASAWGARARADCMGPGHDCRGTCRHNCQNR